MDRKETKSIKKYIQLHLVILIYTLSSVCSKLVAESINSDGLFSLKTIVFLGILFLSLAVYAVFWQQIIKKVDLTVAYVNKGVTILWTLFWSVILFNETITINSLIGALIVIAGIVVVNYEQ